MKSIGLSSMIVLNERRDSWRDAKEVNVVNFLNRNKIHVLAERLPACMNI